MQIFSNTLNITISEKKHSIPMNFGTTTECLSTQILNKLLNFRILMLNQHFRILLVFSKMYLNILSASKKILADSLKNKKNNFFHI